MTETPPLDTLAIRHRTGSGPTIVFLPGYASDMQGTKAIALDDWAARNGRAMLRFDYSGCGQSPGRFEDATLTTWRDDALRAIAAIDGPLILVGSSMGGWLMLHVALALGDRVSALVGIAAAPDFTRWGYTDAEKATIARDGELRQPSPYGEPMLTTRALYDSSEALCVLDAEIAIDCPVRLLHGQADIDVPWETSMKLAARLRSADVQTILVKDGDHRMSRSQDIALLIATVEALCETS